MKRHLILTIAILCLIVDTHGQDFWQKTNFLFAGQVTSMGTARGWVYAGSQTGIYRTSDKGQTWDQQFSNIAGQPNAMAVDTATGIVYIAIYPGGFYRSTDHGASWSSVRLQGNIILTIVVTKYGTVIVASKGGSAGQQGAFRSTDHGDNWTQPLNNNYQIWSLAVDDNNVLYAGSETTNGSDCGTFLMKSSDDGVSWSPDTIFSNVCAIPRGIVVDHVGNILVESRGYLFRSSDNGTSWDTAKVGSISNFNTIPFVVDRLNHIYCGSYDSPFVYRSLDSGKTFQAFGSGIPGSLTVDAMTLDADGYIYCAGGGSLICRGATVEAVANDHNPFPRTYALSQNYPNPFNPSTTFQYDLPERSRVRLALYNVLGQVVKTLRDDLESAGHRSFEWNSTDGAGNLVSSGVYFCRLEAAGTASSSKTFVQVKKMLLIR